MKLYKAIFDRRAPYSNHLYRREVIIEARTLKSAEKKAEKYGDDCYGTMFLRSVEEITSDEGEVKNEYRN